MKKLKQLFKCCDIYGSPVALNINQKEKIKTIPGAFLSLVWIAILIAFTVSYGHDISNSYTPPEDIQYSKRPFYRLTNDNFPVAVAFQTYNQQTYVNPKYFKFEAINVKTFNQNSTTITTSYEFEPCTDKHFPNFSSAYLLNAGTSKYMCVKNQELNIGGYWDNDYIQYVIFRLRMCNNGTDGNCASKDEINNWINREPIAFNLYFQNSIVNIRNYEQTVQNFIGVVYKNVKTTASKVLNIYLMEQEILTDTGYVTSDIKAQTTYSYDKDDSDESDQTEGSLMDINLFVSNHKMIFLRQHIRAQTIMAFLGGLGQFFYVIGCFLTCCGSRLKLHQKIFNKLFNFNEEGGSPLPSKLSNEYGQAGTVSPKRPINPNYKEDVESRKELSVRSERVNLGIRDDVAKNVTIRRTPFEQPKKLKLNWIERKLRICKCGSEKSKAKYALFERARTKVLASLDVTSILGRLEDYEKFKLTMLNFEQLAMFRSISKDMLTLDDRDRIDAELKKVDQILENRNNFVQLLNTYKVKNGDQYSAVDKRLISMLDDQYKSALE
jgi:hypothetical protein